MEKFLENQTIETDIYGTIEPKTDIIETDKKPAFISFKQDITINTKLSINAWRIISIIHDRITDDDMQSSLFFISVNNYSHIFHLASNSYTQLQSGAKELMRTIISSEGTHEQLINNYGLNNGIMTINIAAGMITLVKNIINPHGLTATRHFVRAASYPLYYKCQQALSNDMLDHTRLLLSPHDFRQLFGLLKNEYYDTDKNTFFFANFRRRILDPASDDINASINTKDNNGNNTTTPGNKSGICIKIDNYTYISKTIAISVDIKRVPRDAAQDNNIVVDKTDFANIYGAQTRRYVNMAIAGGANINAIIYKLDAVGTNIVCNSIKYAYLNCNYDGAAYRYTCMLNDQTSDNGPDCSYDFSFLTADILPYNTYDGWQMLIDSLNDTQKAKLATYITKNLQNAPLIKRAFARYGNKLYTGKSCILIAEAMRRLAIYDKDFCLDIANFISTQNIIDHEAYKIIDILNDPLMSNPVEYEKAAAVRYLMVQGITEPADLKKLIDYDLSYIVSNINYAKRYLTHCKHSKDTVSNYIDAIVNDRAGFNCHTTPLFNAAPTTEASTDPEITTNADAIATNKLRKAFMSFAPNIRQQLVDNAKDIAGSNIIYFNNKTEADMWADIDTVQYLTDATKKYITNLSKALNV